MNSQLLGSMPRGLFARSIATIAFACFACGAHAAPGPNLLRDGGFDNAHPFWPEYPDLGGDVLDDWQTDDRSQDSSTAGADFFQNAVIADTTTHYGDVAGGSGASAAVMYNHASMWQTFSVGAAGTYSISWLDASAQTGRSYNKSLFDTSILVAYGLHYQVTLGGQVLGKFVAEVGQDFTRHSFVVDLAPGEYTLRFTGLDHGKISHFGGAGQYSLQQTTHIALFDDVTVAAVPEPGTYALMLAGIGALSVGAKRRRAHRG
ncbi:PEP-CTERM sorting domain-containing protein [Eleftheria terrae]|uniref:PEP-CTERM sorting domain-containing protein n=1 Tax=Eleftheria terrae TaxID=1597781 RepID=UPI00263AD385|nr:PEP-CTERM sorting domain-containing protein [Eleftheria terrae]WKB52899.1 PEP-CTERM sorting domain-containing protein [Eleftheria terrae]